MTAHDRFIRGAEAVRNSRRRVTRLAISLVFWFVCDGIVRACPPRPWPRPGRHFCHSGGFSSRHSPARPAWRATRARPGAAASRSGRHDEPLCRPQPAQPSIVPAGNPRLAASISNSYATDAGGVREPAILPAALGVRALCGCDVSPVHRIHRQARSGPNDPWCQFGVSRASPRPGRQPSGCAVFVFFL
jgi:hypothetical protein